ncbi:MAG: hypothetical protein R3D60_08650 [Paracoccaceae bacterium]
MTQHNGFTRVRRSNTQAGDDLILAQFEDANPASPAGYRSLVENQNASVRNRVSIEVIGEMAGPGTSVERVLRSTVDVDAANLSQIARAGGTITLLGGDHVIMGGGGALRTSADNVLYLGLDFDNRTAALHIVHDFGRTWRYAQRNDSLDLLGENLAFNPETGLFGGEITGEAIHSLGNVGTFTVTMEGTVLGAVGGSSADDLVAGGIFQAEGTMPYIGTLTADGVFWASN